MRIKYCFSVLLLNESQKQWICDISLRNKINFPEKYYSIIRKPIEKFDLYFEYLSKSEYKSMFNSLYDIRHKCLPKKLNLILKFWAKYSLDLIPGSPKLTKHLSAFGRKSNFETTKLIQTLNVFLFGNDFTVFCFEKNVFCMKNTIREIGEYILR